VSQPVGIGGPLTSVVQAARYVYFAGRQQDLNARQRAAFEEAGGTREWIKVPGNTKTPQQFRYMYRGQPISFDVAKNIAQAQLGNRPWKVPETDTEIADFESSSGIDQSQVAPYVLPEIMPAPGQTIPAAAVSVVGRIGGLFGGILWPSETASPAQDLPPPPKPPGELPPIPDFENFHLPPWLIPQPPGEIFAPFFPDPSVVEPLPAPVANPLPAPTVKPIPEPPAIDPTAPIETVTVTAPRPVPYQPPEILPIPAPVFAPTPAPLPKPVPSPYSSPGNPNPRWWLAPIPGQWTPRARPRDPSPLPVAPPTVEPFTPSTPAPFAPNAPAPFAPPQVFPTEFPFAPPAPTPLPTQIPFAPPSVSPGATTFPFLPPLPGLTPFNPTGVGYNPLPAQFAQPAKPPNDQNRCRCTTEKKKRKKREDRKVCWQGTYREMARGVIKHRKERVSCRP